MADNNSTTSFELTLDRGDWDAIVYRLSAIEPDLAKYIDDATDGTFPHDSVTISFKKRSIMMRVREEYNNLSKPSSSST